MRTHLLKCVKVTVIGATMLASAGAACGGATISGPGSAEPAETSTLEYQPPDSLPGAHEARLGPACHEPVLDATARHYLEAGIVELPGAVVGPARPTCEPAETGVLEPAETSVPEPAATAIVEPDELPVMPL